MHRGGILVIIVAILILAAPSAHAQGKARGGLRRGNVAPVQLLTFNEVRTELKLTDEQKKQTDALHDEYAKARKQIMGDVDKDSGERGPKMKELEGKMRDGLAKILDAAQQKRLKELSVQVNGAAVLDDEAIAAELKITPEQEKQLAAIRKANAQARRDALKKLADGGEGSRNEILAKLQTEGDAKLLAILTPEQRKQFEDMQGKKLELKVFQA